MPRGVYERHRAKEHCTVDGCGREHAARGLCLMHYKRARRNGQPGPAGHVYGTDVDDAQRILGRYRLDGDCWVWTGKKCSGYGAASVGGRRTYMHRWMYEHHVAPIPAGLELDHLCRNKICGNPYHLEPVTHQVNIARAAASDVLIAFEIETTRRSA